MLDDPELVATIYVVGGLTFLVALFVGSGWTVARVIFYRLARKARPSLLTRDVMVFGGFSLSFGLITLIRFLPLQQRLALTTGNVLWALATTVPACLSVIVYAYYEIVKIKINPPVDDAEAVA